MFTYFNLTVLVLVLTSPDQVYAGKIIGGHKAVPHSRPYMVLLEIKDDNNQKKYCAGFLLSEDFVMTAAHCQAKSYQVFLGMDSFYDKEKYVLTVKQAFPHADYCKHSYKNDIMLLKLSSKANITNHVKPIALADHFDAPLPKSCSVAGWGKTSNESKWMSLQLMEVNVKLIDDEECAEEDMFCSEGNMGPGGGDSGGPLVCDDEKAYGVVSASVPLSSGFTLYMYTKIPDNQEWINYFMKYI
ncbi:granzyme G-like [Nematolebias whitei]|uniref:granzyme G-like n=1 Tax=Nematolebias whitei TaxID=451745 RepID=UPI0018985439|nr:granzyme G-like [Nematolebias whitei]